MFSISDNKGFKISFNNGYTVSVQFGGGNYCSNRALPRTEWGNSDTAETALISPDGFVVYQGDDVQGHMSPKDVLELLNYAEGLPGYGVYCCDSNHCLYCERQRRQRRQRNER